MGQHSSLIAAALRFFEGLGRRTAAGLNEFGFGAALLAESLMWVVTGRARRQPVRLAAVFSEMMQVGIHAIPIVTVLAATIGVMLAIQGIHTLRNFGAESRVTVGIALAITREFAPLITGILIAGRSGSALAARLGTMSINQEIDALRVMGINPVRFLVAPSLLAMLVMVPALTFWADLLGLLGAGLFISVELGMTLVVYFDRVLEVVTVEDLLHGLSKSIIFAILITLVGVVNGASVTGGAEGLGPRDDPGGGAIHHGHYYHGHVVRLYHDAMMTAAKPTSNVVIEVRNLVTHYGDRLILQDVSLAVREGEILVIMGGSGSGKSTLLRYLLALERPTSGSIEVLGVDVVNARPRDMYELRKKMGVAFQFGALFSSMTVGENITLPLREHTELDALTMQIMARLKLEVVDLAGFEDLKPAELSGGMVKRAALARPWSWIQNCFFVMNLRQGSIRSWRRHWIT